ncbi:MAG: hypothetical protein Aurels2KO_40180 [Aureliella sp.]
MSDNEDLLKEHLAGLGLSEKETQAVYEKVAQYDRETNHLSVFDSIERGTFDLQAIIEEARNEQDS